jgi:4-amino-4-deoxy-L-arabinose transferase-like glycosyltransferase
MISPRRAGFLVAALIAARATAGMLLPLTADEAYYWLWSKHLDFGYFDHPPAIAWAIRAGTLLFGDTVLGVRASAIILSIATSWLVFESALAILADRPRAWLAALLFNLTLMVGAEMLAATPDMPSVACSALFLFGLARLQQSGNGRWWLVVGVAGGLGLLSKYSAGFLGLGAILWMAADGQARRWLRTPWPWTGGAVALLLFLPNLLWQAAHQWETFAFQLGRVAGSRLTGRFLIEFFSAEFGLATPGIFVLGMAGWVQARRGGALFLLSALMLPASAYFLIHALHDRVQGNWPAFLFPAFAILAAAAFGEESRLRRWCSLFAMPLAGLMLMLVYAQAMTGIFPLGKNDALARLLGRGFRPVADALPDAARAAHAGAILTTDYETAAWLRFYQPGMPVIEAAEPWRYPNAPTPSLELLSSPLLYVVEQKRDRRALLADYFQLVEPVTVLQIKRNGVELSTYEIYRVEGNKGAIPSKMP